MAVVAVAENTLIKGFFLALSVRLKDWRAFLCDLCVEVGYGFDFCVEVGCEFLVETDDGVIDCGWVPDPDVAGDGGRG